MFLNERHRLITHNFGIALDRCEFVFRYAMELGHGKNVQKSAHQSRDYEPTTCVRVYYLCAVVTYQRTMDEATIAVEKKK